MYLVPVSLNAILRCYDGHATHRTVQTIIIQPSRQNIDTLQPGNQDQRAIGTFVQMYQWNISINSVFCRLMRNIQSMLMQFEISGWIA